MVNGKLANLSKHSIDGDNIIKNTAYVINTETYTATEDCYIICSSNGGGLHGLYINGVAVWWINLGTLTPSNVCFPLKNGDVAIVKGNSDYATAYTIYGVK